jgi:hypothetical protein
VGADPEPNDRIFLSSSVISCISNASPLTHRRGPPIHIDFVVLRGADRSHVGVLAPRYHKWGMRTSARVHPKFVVLRGADRSHVGVLAPRYHKWGMRTSARECCTPGRIMVYSAKSADVLRLSGGVSSQRNPPSHV